MKKILFFDGDGTLWYPKATKRTVKPFWVYLDEKTKNNFLDHLEIAPTVIETLTLLRKKGVRLIILSTHPDKLKNADKVLYSKVKNFDLHDLFDAYYVTAEYPEAKGEKIVEIINGLNIKKSDALMIGDSYKWDFESAKNFGVDALLINSDYHLEHIQEEPVDKDKVIEEVEEILNHI